jgi:hypothetical protein
MILLGLLIFLIIVGGGILFWQSSARDRELATRISKQMCERHNVQFLDGTAILDTFRIRRGDSGHLGFMRRYHFEFYNGSERLNGKVTVFHHEITELYLENPLPEITRPAERDLFNSANEVSNVIEFPKKDPKP